ncbi:CDP-alcohol phosphatidyltransferase family protein [Halodesulfurarchaeum sp.]|uniref:CDP-alcohol phosphatidyltransferase family protein n=1 Tax=Halodesulfurarchaeum sp. TaxID=1980530 RepID=UPI001BC2F4EE|nr:CDP-alcohol phosphatidyltransferase family protein [Halodesulfurarchaeum sp.]
MTLDRLRPIANLFLDPFVGTAKRIGLSPDEISLLAFLLAVAAGISFLQARPTWYLAGAIFVFLNGWLDLLDGALARELETDSQAGNLLDHVLDRYADIVVVAGLAGGLGQFALGFAAITGVLLTSYLGTQIEAVGLEREYGGLLGRADRLALVGLVAVIVPFYPAIAGISLVAILLAVLAVVGHVTAVQRFVGAWGEL